MQIGAVSLQSPDDIIGELDRAPAVNEAVKNRPRPEHKRVWASIEKEPEAVIEQAFQEGIKRDTDRSKTWVGLVDGNRSQIAALEATAARHRLCLIIIVDLIHVIEYLWKAAWVLYEKKQAEEQNVFGELIALWNS